MTVQKIANLQGQDFNGRLGLLSAGRLNDDQIVAQTSNGICLKNKCEFDLTTIKTVTSAEVLALNATPILIVPAPGDGFATIIKRVDIYHAAGTAYAAGASTGLALRYKDSGGAIVSTTVEVAGFLDQVSEKTVYAAPISSNVIAFNTTVLLHSLSGELTTGDFDLVVRAVYDIVPTVIA